jgi:hypothetical protein
MFLKAQSGGGVAGTTYIEQFDVEVLEMIEVEIVDDTITVEIIEIIDVEIADDPIEVEIT